MVDLDFFMFSLVVCSVIFTVIMIQWLLNRLINIGDRMYMFISP